MQKQIPCGNDRLEKQMRLCLSFCHSRRESASAFSGSPSRISAVFTVNFEKQGKSLPARGRRIIAKGSGHSIQLSRPDLVDRDVSLFIEQIRGMAPEPADFRA